MLSQVFLKLVKLKEKEEEKCMDSEDALPLPLPLGKLFTLPLLLVFSIGAAFVSEALLALVDSERMLSCQKRRRGLVEPRLGPIW